MTVDVRARLEHEAENSTDARSRLAALRELRLLNQDEGVTTAPPRDPLFEPSDVRCPECGHEFSLNDSDSGVILLFPLPPDHVPSTDEERIEYHEGKVRELRGEAEPDDPASRNRAARRKLNRPSTWLGPVDAEPEDAFAAYERFEEPDDA